MPAMRRVILAVSVAIVSLALSAGCADTHAPVGPAGEVAPAPASTTIIVSHGEAGTLSVIDTARLEVVATIDVGGRIDAFAVGPGAERVFVATPGAIAVVDVPARRVVDTIALPGERTGLALAGDRLYLVENQTDKGRVSVLSLRDRTVTATREIDAVAGEPVLTADGRRLFVPHHFYSGRVTALDASSLAVQASMTFEDGVSRPSLGPGDRLLYAPNGSTFDGRVTIMDASTHRLVAEVVLDGEPMDLTLDPSGHRAYATLFHNHAVGVIDLERRALERTVPVADYPGAIAVSGDGMLVFVAHNGTPDLSVVDTRAFTVRTLRLPAEPHDLAAPPRFIAR